MGLLATDLDGTFIGDDTAALELWRELDERAITVVFATGRHLHSVLDLCARIGTSMRPEACICMVGTEIWHLSASDYQLDTTWRNQMARGWMRDAVAASVLGLVPDAKLQPDEWQSPFKISYFVEGLGNEGVTELSGALSSRGLEAKVVYSADRFLDLLPAHSGKGAALNFLVRELGLTPTDVIVAGDSGNDLDMMRPELGFRSIAVGNAAPELATHRAPGLYHARASYARGIREGLVRHGWLPSGQRSST